MKSTSTAKEQVLRILDKFEKVYAENLALKAMLSTCNDPRVRDTWEARLHEFLQHPETEPFLERMRTIFGVLRAQVRDALDEEAALRVLLEMPITGKPN